MAGTTLEALRDLLDQADDLVVREEGPKVVHHEDPRILDLRDERERDPRVVGAHLLGHPVSAQTLCGRPCPYGKARCRGGAAQDVHETHLVVHLRHDQGMPRGEEQSEIGGAVHAAPP